MEPYKLDGGGLAYIYAIVSIRVREDVLFVLESIEILLQGVVLLCTYLLWAHGSSPLRGLVRIG
jgi:hypothetical protein